MMNPIKNVHDLFLSGDLYTAFETGLNIGTIGTPVYLFNQIYAPIKIPTASGMPATWTYIDIGFDKQTIAEIYDIHFSRNYLVFDNVTNLGYKINRIVRENLYKYKRLIEIQGYAFNPLWNVDADEKYATVEKHGTVTDTNTHKYDEETTHTVNQDVTNFSRDYAGTAPGATAWDTKTTTSATDSNQRHNRTNTVTDNQDKLEKKYTGISGVSATAANNALEFALTDGDYTHVERHVRQGNIGVTKTTELLEDARKYVIFNVLNELFKDLNDVLLVGVFK